MEEKRFEEMENMNEAYDVMEVVDTCDQTSESTKKSGSLLKTIGIGALIVVGAKIAADKLGITEKLKSSKDKRAIKRLEKRGYCVTTLPEAKEVQVKFEEPNDENLEVEENLD